MGEQGIYDQQVHRFHKGMDMDSDYSVLQENTYPYAENFRLTKSGDAITGVLENIDGFNKISLTYTKDSIEIIGHCVIRKYVILFARSIAGNILEKNGYIFRLELKYDDRNNPLFVDRNLNNCLIYSDLE
jgi:hypothetical protein